MARPYDGGVYCEPTLADIPDGVHIFVLQYPSLSELDGRQEGEYSLQVDNFLTPNIIAIRIMFHCLGVPKIVVWRL